MDAARYELRGARADAALIDELAARHPRIGLSGVLSRRGTRARPGRVPAEAAVEGFRWGLLDSVTPRWWPQGVEVLDVAGGTGADILLISWFAQKGRGPHRGSRISVVDRRDPRRPRYHHVLLVEPVREGTELRMRAVDIHAGGLALLGTRLFAAATFGGLREFDLDDVLHITGHGPFGARLVLPQSGVHALHGGRGDGRMRFSFVSVDHGRAAEGPHLVIGEYGPDSNGRRLGRARISDKQAGAITELHEPRIPRMQGAAVIDGRWFVSASNGTKPGDLWVGGGANWTCHAGVLPAGPEDLAATRDGRQLWSLCEYPRRRWVYAIDPGRWRS